MDKYSLPKSTIINGKECPFNSDYRDILKVFEILNDPDLITIERIEVALDYFYSDDSYKIDYEQAIEEMFSFINMCQPEQQTHSEPLFNWEQDFQIIAAPVNRILGIDIRDIEYLHWWTFLSAFYEIGECTFNTYVGIRDKLNHGKKLEKYEETILRENRSSVVLKKKVDSSTQDLMDIIMGKEV